YLRQAHPSAVRLYVVGGGGLVDELQKEGFICTGGPAEDDEKFTEEGFKSLADAVGEEMFDGVVVGWDTALTYRKVAKSALVFQRHPEAFFYATNDDAADRVGGWMLPGNGPLLGAIEAACAACAPE
ncbi:unnamed protein product, partial [Polarella glacialis]